MATKILVVDDDLNICDLLRLYFENEGYEVKTIKCSASAAVIDVKEDKTVTVQLNADDLNKDTFSVMVIYRKVD